MTVQALFKPALLALLVSVSCHAQAQNQTFTGTVVNKQGQPVANAKVHVHGRQQYVYTNEKGEFSIQSPAKAEIHIAAKGYGDQFVQANDAQLKVTLQEGGTERMIVSASGLHHYDFDMAHPVSVLSGEKLSLKTEATIGETLKTIPGVHSNYYGPVAASPVIRGLDGPRVKVLSNGLDTGDVSRVGPDHAITADAITTEQIEVLRGPATLLYGSGAIGGVVNVVDNRIPRQLRAPQTTIDSRFNTVADEKTLSLSHDGAVDQVAWHFDGFDRNSNDFSTPEFKNDAGENTNKLANSWLDNQAVNGGLSWVGSQGLFGVTVGHIDSQYGIPAHEHHHEHEEETETAPHEDEGVYADLKQDRVGFAGEIYSPLAGIETLSVNGAYTDYKHAEVEAGAAGTTFSNKALENRISVEHVDIAGWHGLIGLHLQHNDYQAVGAEAFTPPSKTNSYALFVLEEKSFGDITAQVGGRFENTKHKAGALLAEHDHAHEEDHADGHTDEAGTEHNYARFNAASVSAGLVWNFKPDYQWALNISRSERAPSAAEIYSNGAHIATKTYEIGLAYQLDDDGEISLFTGDMQREVANNIDLGFRKIAGDFTFSYNFFYNQVDNYLYQNFTDFSMGDLASHGEAHDHDHEEEGHDHGHDHGHDSFFVYQYQQHDALLYGLEFEMAYQFTPSQQLNVFADSVRAKLKNVGHMPYIGAENLPRIPPLKAGIEYQYQAQQWSANVGATYYARQDKIHFFESETAGYALFDASVSYYFDLQSIDMTAFLKGTNLTDKLGYVHSSFIKTQAPLPGRAITLGLTARF